MIEQRVVVDLHKWAEAWKHYQELIDFEFERLRKADDSAYRTLEINWRKECAGRQFQRLKGEMEGTYVRGNC